MYTKVVSGSARNILVAAIFLSSYAMQEASGATLAWNASTSPNITAYTVRYGTTRGNYPNVLNAGTALTLTLPALAVGPTYYFVVTARNASGTESDPSNEIAYTPSGTLPNVLPTLDAIGNRTISEDAGQQTVALSGITAGLGDLLQLLNVTASSSNPGLVPNPSVTYTSPSTTGSLRLTPVANANGTAVITVTVNDGGLLNNLLSRTFSVTINPVNDPPTLNAINNLSLNVNAAQQTVSLAGISSGAANESQTLTVTASSSNPGLIPTPSITYSSPASGGSLRFTPVAGISGTATITVSVNDGQSQNNIVSRSFAVSVSSTANTPPTLNALPNVALNEDVGQQTINLAGIAAGAASETQTLTVTATSSNPALIPNPSVTYSSPASTGTARLTPVANASGTATITVTVNDGQSQNNTISRSFVATVNAVNDAPTLNALGNLSLATSAGQQTVSLSGISSGAANENQTLTVTASSSNPSLIPAPTITYSSPASTGTLRFTPVAGATGTATITVNVNDGPGQNNLVSRSFTVTVAGSASQTLYVEAESGTRGSPMLTAFDANAANGQYVYSSGNNAGTVSFPINITQAGTYWVWCRVLSPDAARDSFFVSMDGGAEEVFTTSPNGWSSTWRWIRINLSGTIRTYSLSPGSHTLVFRGREPSTFLDALYVTSSASFVPPGGGTQNFPPTLNPLGNLTLNPNVGPQTVSLTGIGPGAANEIQTLMVTATSSNPGLIPHPVVTYTSPSSSGTLRLAPTLNATGTATITVAVSDGQSQNHSVTRSFTVTITPPPSLFVRLEAEAGTLTPPMTLASDTVASGGRYVFSSADNQGTISIPVNIPVAGSYRVWCRVLSTDNSKDSFFVTVDGGPEEIFVTAQNTWSTSWQWTRLNGHLTGGQRIFNWSAGVHTLVFRGRERGTFLDALYITNDESLVPQPDVPPQGPIIFTAAGVDEVSPETEPDVEIPLSPADAPSAAGAGAKVTGLAVARADARSVTLAWQTDKPAQCLANYGASDYHYTPWSMEPAIQHEARLTGLEPGATHVVRILTADADGNLAWTEPATVTTPEISLVAWSAEDGLLDGTIVMQNDNTALNNGCIVGGEGATGVAYYPVHITGASDYWLWCRVLSPVDTAFLGASINGDPEQTPGVSSQDDWQWIRINGQALQIETGLQHIYVRVGEMALDEFLLSNDPDWHPGHQW